MALAYHDVAYLSREQNKNAIKRDKAELAQSLASVSILFKIINVVFFIFYAEELDKQGAPARVGRLEFFCLLVLLIKQNIIDNSDVGRSDCTISVLITVDHILGVAIKEVVV